MSNRQSLPRPFLIAASLALLLTVLIYGNAVRLPFYSDDLLQVPWAKSTPLPNFWYQEGPYGDYRPLHFTIWHLLYRATGDLSPALLHGLNLAGHILCGTLAGLLAAAWYQKRRLLATALTTTLFTLFPFAFDAVLWVSSFSYFLTTALTLGALLLYLHARKEKKPWAHGIALLFTALAAFAYEGGIIAGFIIIWSEVLSKRKPFSPWALGHGVISGIIAVGIYLSSTSIPAKYLTGDHPLRNFVSALQCIVFPVAPAALIGNLIDIRPLILLVPLGIITLLGLARLVIKQKRGQGFLLGLGWALLWSVIPILSQPFDWFRDPLRVFYPSAVGTAILWTDILFSFKPAHLPSRWQRSAPIILAAILLIPVVTFLHRETTLYQQAGDLLWDAIRVAQSQPGALLVNLPSRITPETQRLYPLGHEGVIPLPPPTNSELLIAVHTEETNQVKARAMGSIVPSIPLDIELADPPLSTQDLREATAIFNVEYQLDSFTLEEIGKVRSGQDSQNTMAHFGESLDLKEASCEWTGPAQVTIKVIWKAKAKLEGAPTVFTHWLNANGELVAQADGDPLHGLYPLAQWDAGDTVQEIRVIKALPNQDGYIAIGIWDPTTGVRWPATTEGSNHAQTEDAFLIRECEP